MDRWNIYKAGLWKNGMLSYNAFGEQKYETKRREDNYYAIFAFAVYGSTVPKL